MKKSEKNSLVEKMARLTTMTEWFQSEEFKLEEATERYRELLVLSKEVEEDLTNLKNEIVRIEADFSKD